MKEDLQIQKKSKMNNNKHALNIRIKSILEGRYNIKIFWREDITLNRERDKIRNRSGHIFNISSKGSSSQLSMNDVT